MLATLLISAAIAAISAAAAPLAWRATRRRRRPVRVVGRLAAATLILVAAPPGGLAAYMTCFLLMPRPVDATRRVGEGATYRRIVAGGPGPSVAHALIVDLDSGARLVLSPPVRTPAGLRFEARTATEWADRLGADLLVNASFFHPFRETHPLSYAPHAGDLVQAIGYLAGPDWSLGADQASESTFWVAPGGAACGLGSPPARVELAVTGYRRLLRDGRPVFEEDPAPYPRSALGLDARRRTLTLLVVDGKQPSYSLGRTLREVASLMLDLGVSDAVELDGGGSATMVARDPSGRSVVLNRPCHTKIPGRERPVATCLGIRLPR